MSKPSFELEVDAKFPTLIRVFSRGSRRFLVLKEWGTFGHTEELTAESCAQLATALGAIPRGKVTAELDKLHRIAAAREVTEDDVQATIDALLTEGRDG